MVAARLDHVTIRTSTLEKSLAFYESFLGLRPGPRPPFDVPGAWLYPPGSDYAILHLIAVEEGSGRDSTTGMFDHFAVRVSGLAGYLAKLKATNSGYRATPVVSTHLVQIHHRDPNGVLIEATFAGETLAKDEIVS